MIDRNNKIVQRVVVAINACVDNWVARHNKKIAQGHPPHLNHTKLARKGERKSEKLRENREKQEKEEKKKEENQEEEGDC